MNFFERQKDLRRMSVRLVLLFAIAVVGIIAVVNVVALFAFGAFSDRPVNVWGIVGIVSLLTAGAIALATLYRTASWAAITSPRTPPIRSCAGCATSLRRSPLLRGYRYPRSMYCRTRRRSTRSRLAGPHRTPRWR